MSKLCLQFYADFFFHSFRKSFLRNVIFVWIVSQFLFPAIRTPSTVSSSFDVCLFLLSVHWNLFLWLGDLFGFYIFFCLFLARGNIFVSNLPFSRIFFLFICFSYRLDFLYFSLYGFLFYLFILIFYIYFLFYFCLFWGFFFFISYIFFIPSRILSLLRTLFFLASSSSLIQFLSVSWFFLLYIRSITRF